MGGDGFVFAPPASCTDAGLCCRAVYVKRENFGTNLLHVSGLQLSCLFLFPVKPSNLWTGSKSQLSEQLAAMMFSRVFFPYPENPTRCEMAQRLLQSECCVGAWVGVYNFLSLLEDVSIRSWFHTTRTSKQRPPKKYSLLGRSAV